MLGKLLVILEPITLADTSSLPGIMASLSARVIIMIDAAERIHDIQMDCELETPPGQSLALSPQWQCHPRAFITRAKV